MLLEVKGLNTFYGNLHAIWDIDIQVHEKEIVALIGSNGAGKSTLLKTIAGSLPMQSGEIIYQGERFNPGHKRKANVMVHKGITLCPEGRHIFPRMTVAENLKMGGYIRQKGDMEAGFDRVYDLFPRLKERDGQMAGTLSGGEQQMLAIGRALMSKPKMLLLDEPSMGLSPILVQEIFHIIENVNKTGMTVLLVEQNAKMALKIASRAYVLETGKIAMSGDAGELAKDPKVQEAYLGG